MGWIKTKPKVGDIVWCYFPYPNIKNSRKHPSLIIFSYTDDNNNHHVMVSGGKSSVDDFNQHIEPKNTDLIIHANANFFKSTNLNNSTYFQFEQMTILMLPYTSELFFCNSNNTPKIGQICFEEKQIVNQFKKINQYIALREVTTDIYSNYIKTNQLA